MIHGGTKNAIISWMLSACKWYLTPYHCTVTPRRHAYNIKSKGTEPRVKPDNNDRISDEILSTEAFWEHCSK